MPRRILLLVTLVAFVFVIPTWTAPVPLKKSGKEITNSIGMKLVRIEAGKFMMGSPSTEIGRRDDEDQHEVEITRPFYMSVYPVTQKEFKAVMERNPSDFKSENRPVEQINWLDAVKFCEKMSALAKEKGRKYRLPTRKGPKAANSECYAGAAGAWMLGDAAPPSGREGSLVSVVTIRASGLSAFHRPSERL